MSVSEFDSYQPPEKPRRRRDGGGRRDAGSADRTGRAALDGEAAATPSDGSGGQTDSGARDGKATGQGRRRGAGAQDGSREMAMVPEPEFTSYYGRPVVKAPPWGEDVPIYLFLGGVAGGSGLLALGAQVTGRSILRRNARLGAMGALAIGGAALVHDLGRPERFLNMLRTFKLTSPMSVGSWILSAYGAGAGVTAVVEFDRLLKYRLPLGPLRKLLHFAETPAGVYAGIFAAPLAGYTAVLLSDTAVPTWNAVREDLPFVFVSSASLAASGLAMITTPTSETLPARILAGVGAAGDVTAMKVMENRLSDVEREPLHDGKPGAMLKWSERLAIGGAIGAVFGGKNRAVAVVSGVALLTASALTRFGIFDAGIHSAKDPRYTIVPQQERLAARREAGVVGDSITTAS